MERTIGVALAFALTTFAAAQPVVRVVVDINPYEPGIQNTVTVGPGQETLHDVAVYIYATAGEPQMRSLGYIGAIDRGLSFGHALHNANRGVVTSIQAHLGTPITFNGDGVLMTDPCCMQRWFAGPEVQYLEFNGAPMPIVAAPTAPAFTVDITLAGHRFLDQFSFYLLDAVAANWRGGRGMFTSGDAGINDTGGDATPDMTPTIAGIDPDEPVAVPPAAFVVDIADALPDLPHRGGALILVTCRADLNGDGLNSQDLFDYLTAFFRDDPVADYNRDERINSSDFFDYLEDFFLGCR